MKLPFKGSLYVYVAAVFDVIRIYPAAIRNGGEVTYWFFMCCPLVLIFLYLTLVLLIDAALNLTKGKSLRLYLSIRIIQLLHCLFFWVLLIPTFDFFISIFECDASTGKHKILTSLTCWSALHACYCAIFSVGLVLFLSITVLISLLNNESRPSNTDSLTRLDTNQEVYLTVYRIILVVVSHYTADYQTYQWLTLILHAIISIHLQKNY